MDQCLLRYRCVTAPSPLRVNWPGGTEQSRLNIAVEFPGPDVQCARITIAVPLGDGPAALFRRAPAAALSTARWEVAPRLAAAGEAGPAHGVEYAQVILRPADPTVRDGVEVSLTGEVNEIVGQASVELAEHSGSPPDAPSIRRGQLVISKLEPAFYLRNFCASAPDAPTVPGSRFRSGQPIHLSWESNGSWFEIYAGGSPDAVYHGQATSCDLEGGLTGDTQLVLVASGNPGRDPARGRYRPIYFYDALTIIVADDRSRVVVTKPTLLLSGREWLESGRATVAINEAAIMDCSSIQVLVTGRRPCGNLRVSKVEADYRTASFTVADSAGSNGAFDWLVIGGLPQNGAPDAPVA